MIETSSFAPIGSVEENVLLDRLFALGGSLLSCTCSTNGCTCTISTKHNEQCKEIKIFSPKPPKTGIEGTLSRPRARYLHLSSDGKVEYWEPLASPTPTILRSRVVEHSFIQTPQLMLSLFLEELGNPINEYELTTTATIVIDSDITVQISHILSLSFLKIYTRSPKGEKTEEERIKKILFHLDDLIEALPLNELPFFTLTKQLINA